MRALVRSGLSREVEIRGRVYRIPPPMIRDALEVIECYPGYAKGGERDTATLLDALSRWMPDVPFLKGWYRILPYASRSRSTLADNAIKIVFTGVETAKSGDKRQKHPDLWQSLIGGYCSVFGADPWTVYTTTPWPFFLRFLREVSRAEANQETRLIEASAFTDMNKEQRQQTIDRLKRITDLDTGPLTKEERLEVLMERSRQGVADLRARRAELGV